MPDKKHSPLIRTIYLYMFAFLGLVFTIVGVIRLVDMGLKTFVFTKADQEQRIYPFSTPYELQRLEQAASTTDKFSDEEIAAIKQWVKDYKDWQQEQSNLDYSTIRKHQQASSSLASILVGLPLYIYHWRIIRKETKNNNQG